MRVAALSSSHVALRVARMWCQCHRDRDYRLCKTYFTLEGGGRDLAAWKNGRGAVECFIVRLIIVMFVVNILVNYVLKDSQAPVSVSSRARAQMVAAEEDSSHATVFK